MSKINVYLAVAFAALAFFSGATAREWFPLLAQRLRLLRIFSVWPLGQLHIWRGATSYLAEGNIISLLDEVETPQSSRILQHESANRNDAAVESPIALANPSLHGEGLRAASATGDRFTPHQALAVLRNLVAQSEQDSSMSPSAKMELKVQLAEQLTKTRRFDEAATLRTQLLAQKSSVTLGASDYVLAAAAIAQDWHHAMDYDKALSVLEMVPLHQLNAASKSILTRMESDIHSWYVLVGRGCAFARLSPSTSCCILF